MTNKVNADSKKINSFLMTLSKLKPRALS
jgi:hypothetical protein